MKRPILYWVILFILGEVLYKQLSIYVVGIVGGIFLIYSIKNRRLGRKWLLQLVGVACFLLGVFCMHSWSRMAKACTMAEGTQVSFAGTVIKKEETSGYVSYIVKTDCLQQKELAVNVQIYLENEASFVLGSFISGAGRVKEFAVATNPGGYDEKAYKQGNGILLALEQVEIAGERKPFFPWRECLYRVQTRLAETYTVLFEEKNASLATAMVLGDKKNLDSNIKELYQRNGIAHLIAISGVKTQNLAIPLTRRNRINSAFVPLHIAKIYILKLCLDEEIIPRCRFPCSRGYFRKCINWQKKQ